MKKSIFAFLLIFSFPALAEKLSFEGERAHTLMVGLHLVGTPIDQKTDRNLIRVKDFKLNWIQHQSGKRIGLISLSCEGNIKSPFFWNSKKLSECGTLSTIVIDSLEAAKVDREKYLKCEGNRCQGAFKSAT